MFRTGRCEVPALWLVSGGSVQWKVKDMFRTGRCEVWGWREIGWNSAQEGARSRHRRRCLEDPSTVHPKGFGWLVSAALYTLKELGGW